MMRKFTLKWAFIFIGVIFFAAGCDEDNSAKEDFTGSEITYHLFAASEYNNEGTITFKERKDGSLQVEVFISNTQAGAIHPLHLHRGPLGVDNDLAALLNPVDGKTGKSSTIISTLGDETKFTFEDVLQFDGSVKIHLDNDQFYNVVLAGGNIGINRLDETGIKNCTDFSIED